MVNTIFDNVNILYNLINDQSIISFKNLKPSNLIAEGAVYLLINIETDKVLYVGRTSNLKQRIYTNHLMGNKSTARLKKYLVEDEHEQDIDSYKKAKEYILNKCGFKYIKSNDSIERGRLEGLFSYLFEVKYIEKEH